MQPSLILHPDIKILKIGNGYVIAANVEGVDKKYIWKYNKTATVLLLFQSQNSLNKTSHSKINDLKIISVF